MGDRLDEARGSIKETVGKVTANERLEAEGEAEHDAARAAREAKGVGNQIKGSVKETLGRATGDEATEASGLADRLKGDAQRTD